MLGSAADASAGVDAGIGFLAAFGAGLTVANGRASTIVEETLNSCFKGFSVKIVSSWDRFAAALTFSSPAWQRTIVGD